jgi:hypothetical protein
MAWEISLPFVALSGAAMTAAMTALAYRFWPRVAVRTYAEKHGGIGVREIAVSISRPSFGRALQRTGGPGSFEFVIYMTLKSCNQ